MKRQEKSTTVRRVIVNEFGGAEQLRVESVEELPRPGAGQVLVDVEAAGVNYIDVYQRKGIYKLPLPFTPGLEGMGRVREVGESGGENISNLVVGQRVAWINVLGSYASHVLVPAGGSVFSYTTDPSEFQRRASAVVEAIGAGWLRVGEGTAYGLERAAEAHRDVEGRGTQGKLYLTP